MQNSIALAGPVDTTTSLRYPCTFLVMYPSNLIDLPDP